ncbi:hypothetical protein L484_021330 [Morus notabilis]|uniref:Protein decapping 5-like n=1 Tax=Morus notabilis TaxID=981085 RepID=W9SG82_9ROSA|nr:protein decapping 5 [Morus notabilis]EXC31028.1 hypothetical protein L484_021330 [Morus notabilis]
MAAESAASAGDSFIGSFISLISKYEIRYEGILYHINVHDSTIGLKNVRSYGTEGRKKDGQQVPPSDKVYEYILFRGSDIKDLQVKSSPPARKEQIHDDPAIIQSQYAGVPASSSPLTPAIKNSLTESTEWQDTPALTSRGYSGTLPSNQSATQQSENSTMSQTTMYWHGYNGASIGTSYPPQHHVNVQPPSVMSSPSTVQPLIQAPEIQASMALGSINASEFRTPVSSSSMPTSVNPKFSPSLSPVQYSASLGVPSLSTQASLPSHSTSPTASTLTTSSIPLSRLDLNINETQIVHKAVSDSIPVLPVQSMPHPTSPFMGSNLSPLLTPPPLLFTPDQSAHSGSYMLSSMQKLYPNQKDMGALVPMPSNSSSSIPTPVIQAPLLPLPTSTQKAVEFTEEFDFTAMNEKFKKDDLWGYLGKGKRTDKAEGTQDNIAGHRTEEKEGHGTLANQKPAYNKDDFFDSISCNSQTRGARNGQHRFSERIKLDTETFGFQQRANPGYGGYAAGGRGENFRGFYNWGRGYGYGGGRGRGGSLPF